MFIKIFLSVSCLLSVCVDSTFYDQSQSGDLNVQVDLKGLQIVALMKGGKEEYVDYDYAYDYSEMTIKPQNRTTPKPISTTSTTVEPAVDNVTIITTAFLENTTAPQQGVETVGATINEVNHRSTTIKNTISYDNITEPTTTTRSTTVVATDLIPTSNGTATTTICKKGFVLNSKGDCELKLQGTGNALLKLVKLSQRLKLRRQNKSGNEDLD